MEKDLDENYYDKNNFDEDDDERNEIPDFSP